MVFGATYLIYLALLLVLILGIKGSIREKKALLLILVSVPIALLLIVIIHLFFFEPRPFANFHFTPIVPEKAGASFPSHHAAITAVLAFAYTYFKSRWSLLLLFIMCWVGLSRIFVGVHYPLDILGGFVTAIVAIFISLQIKKNLEARFLR